MYYWHRSVLPRINNIIKSDAQFMSLYQNFIEAEQVYQTIMEKLTEEEKKQVGDYIALCEDMEYRKTQIAYHIGMVDGAVGREGTL